MSAEAALRADARDRLARVEARIEAAAERAGREPDSITLVGVSKRQPNERIAATVAAGLSVLGENFVQEAQAKRAAVDALLPAETPSPRWRFIGQLQRNKARLVAEHFDACDSVDRAPLATELSKRAAAAERVLDACVQVNLSDEAQKGGIAPDALPELLAHCAGLPGLRIVGLMTLPAAGDAEAARPAFAQLRALRDTLVGAPGGEALRELSMGMSNDFEVAIEEGATLVRVGTALFGDRLTKAEPAKRSRPTQGSRVQ